MLQRITRSPSELRGRLLRSVVGPSKQALTLLLAAALALPAHGLTAPAPSSGATATGPAAFDRAERERRLTATLAAIGDLRNALNRAEFDTEALLESLDYDPEAIIDFVRDEIRFEPYEGLLRGVQGTLMSRAGNTLDQSLLLAFLLGEAGADARLAHGTLDPEQALLLVRSLRGQPPPVPANDLSDLRSHIEKLAQVAGADNATTDTIMQSIDNARTLQELPIWTAAEAGRDYLQEHLSQAGITLEPADAEPQLAAQSLGYFWVEYKDGAASRWERVHTLPAGDAFDEQAVPALEYFTDTVPERFQHRLRLSAKLERQAGGKTEVVDLMHPWERPVANMTGKRLSFANQPNGIKSLQDLEDLNLVEARTTLLIPNLNDAPAPGAQAFDLRGRTIALSALQMDGMGAAALFQTTGDKTLDAADALAGLSIGKPRKDAATAAYSLRRVWLEYISIHPNGTERVDERTIWQAPPAMSPTVPAMLWELATPHGIGLASSAYPASYLLDLELSRLQSLAPLLQWALAAQDIPAGHPLPPQPDLGASAMGFPELAYLSQFDAGINAEAGSLLAYRAEPTIVVTRQGLRNAQGQTTAFADVDIVHNRRSVLRRDASSIQTAPLHAMRLGAWDTLVEQVELEKRLPMLIGAVSAPVISANRMYRDPAHRNQAPLILQHLEDLAALPDNKLDDASRLALEEDLQRGYLVAMETPAHPHPLVWWRVNPTTGETLGRALDGRGQSMTEAGTALMLISIPISTVVGTGICYGSNNSCSFAQCLATAYITASVGAAIGAQASLAIGIGGLIGALGAIASVAAGLTFHPIANALPDGGPIPSCFF